MIRLWLNMKVYSKGFVNRLDVDCERKRVKDDSKLFASSSQKHGG